MDVIECVDAETGAVVATCFAPSGHPLAEQPEAKRPRGRMERGERGEILEEYDGPVCVHTERRPSAFPGWDIVDVRNADGSVRRREDGTPVTTTIQSGEPCPICCGDTDHAA